MASRAALASQGARGMVRFLHMLLGLGDYEAYLRHMREAHADRTPMTRAEFTRNREAHKFGRGRGGRCC
jgi:uncharacterized short protein YbdD (DUF466 family)